MHGQFSECRVGTLVAPSEQVILEMDFLEQGFIQEAAELAHPSPIKVVIVLILSSIDQIKITT
jgi:hypothetical protein